MVTYDYRNCSSLFGYALRTHIRSYCTCALCGLTAGFPPNGAIFRQLCIEHIIGHAQGGYPNQIFDAVRARYPELLPPEQSVLADRIHDANTVTVCSFCHASTSRNHHSHSLTSLIENGPDDPDRLLDTIGHELDEALYHKREAIISKVEAIQNAFLERVVPQLPCRRGSSDELIEFRDDDRAYGNWLMLNPKGYVINCLRHPTPGYLVIHRATCPHIQTGTHGATMTCGAYAKVCAPLLRSLNVWAMSIGGSPHLCSHCHPDRF